MAHKKMRPVVIVLGSPRKNGNSAMLARAVGEGARAAGAEIKEFYVHGMKIAPCSACNKCRGKMSDECVVKDDMRKIYPALRTCRALVIASPIYKAMVSAQTKLFYDRTYALGGADGNALRGKKVGVVLTYGDSDPLTSGAMNAVRMFQDSLGFSGAVLEGIVHAAAEEPGEVRENERAMEEARELGRKLAAG